MAHVHISLVGKEIAPVYSGLLYVSIEQFVTRLVLVCSEQTHELAQSFKRALPIEVELLECNPNDLVDINNAFEKLRESISHKDKVSVNLVGGTKAWALWLYESLRTNENVQFIITTQNYEIWNILDRTKEVLEFDPEIQLRLYGRNLMLGSKITEYNDKDKESLYIVESIRKQADINTFNTLTFKFPENKKRLWTEQLANEISGNFEHDSSYITWRKGKEETATITISTENGIAKETIKSPHALSILFNSGWFEYKVADILNGWPQSKEIWLNNHVQLSNGRDLNELDIIVNAGRKLLFVECKVSIYNTTDIDKFNSVYQTYGGGSSKALLIVYGKLTREIKEKCKGYGIMAYSFTDNHSADSLYKLLDKNILSSNI